MKTLNIIGAGHVGKTLGYLWNQRGSFQIQDVLNQSVQSATDAISFMGAGTAVACFDDLRPADVYLISTADNMIEASCDRLVKAESIPVGSMVFHCSGGVPSSVLSEAKRVGALVASVHPVKSFADPALSVESFQGTYCGIEGDLAAANWLKTLIEGIGGVAFDIDPQNKAVYHAASVMVCNYLVTLLDVGLKAYQHAGLERETALRLIQPIVRGTVDNVFQLDTVQALTGPIARGDHLTVSKQLHELNHWDKDVGELYRMLGALTLELSEAQKHATAHDLSILRSVLSRKS